MNDKYLERVSAGWSLVGVVLIFYSLYKAAVGEAEIMPIVPIVQGAVLTALGIMGIRFTRLDRVWLGVVILAVINIVVDFAGIYFYRSYPSALFSSLSTFLGLQGIAYLYWCVMYYKLVYSKYWKDGTHKEG